DVAEVAELAVEAAVDPLGDQLVVGRVLDQSQLLELGEQVANRILAEARLQLAALVRPVEGVEQLPPLGVRVLYVDVGPGAGPEQVEVAVGRFHPLRRSLDPRAHRWRRSHRYRWRPRDPPN